MSSLVFHLPATILHAHASSSVLRRAPSLARLLVASCHSSSTPPGSKPKKQRLFKIAGRVRSGKTFRATVVPVPVKSTSYSTPSSRNLYVLTDVYHKAIEVETTTSTSKGADRVVAIAFTLNVCDAAFKYTAAYLTGSKSLFAEAIHSTMDTCNQLILLMGIRYSARNPDNLFPYGYGNMRYVTSLISGCGIMAFGCGLSIYHGVSGLLHPAELEPLNYAYYALFMSFCFRKHQGFVLCASIEKQGAGLHSELSVAIALCAVSLSSILASPIPDSVGSIMIGCLLGTVASFIIRTNAAHLVGRSLPKRITDDIVCRLNNDPVIRSVHDVKATALGVEQSRFKAELDFDGREITRAYLHQNVHLPTLLKVGVTR
ncbi:cation diffusion facilitator family transporter [Ostertagia ostertagi]